MFAASRIAGIGTVIDPMTDPVRGVTPEGDVSDGIARSQTDLAGVLS